MKEQLIQKAKANALKEQRRKRSASDADQGDSCRSLPAGTAAKVIPFPSMWREVPRSLASIIGKPETFIQQWLDTMAPERNQDDMQKMSFEKRDDLDTEDKK